MTYAELLGLYLGDGHISQLARTQSSAHLARCALPAIVDDTEALLSRCFPNNRVGRVVFRRRRRGRASTSTAATSPACSRSTGRARSTSARSCSRTGSEAIVDAAPWSFLRGCIRSDGCVFVNRTGRYEYLSYGFANYSADILDLVESTCRAQGLSPRRYARAIRLNRRDDVARLLEHVGLKS